MPISSPLPVVRWRRRRPSFSCWSRSSCWQMSA